MDIKQYIQLCSVKRGGVSQRRLAEMIGTTPQNLNIKLAHNRLRVEELERIADALGADLKVSFIDRATGEPVI